MSLSIFSFCFPCPEVYREENDCESITAITTDAIAIISRNVDAINPLMPGGNKKVTHT